MRHYVTQSYTVRRQSLQIVPPCPPCPCTPGIIRTETYQYTAISDGVKNVYTNSDAVMPFSTSGILDPNEVSVVNLFINGMLQPPNLYVVQPGVLILSDVPVQGVPLILQFIKMIVS
ncbi:DUF4183 domain-containing protein [Brevibacillus brevis]|uniref:DUF4183 domain-containing protein n=1 Tax=Brevibacillus brevis TaxID=1393 RepID=UPI001902AF3B|nr:DUF4183 domain-containing protein [Brevibacillus brevis]